MPDISFDQLLSSPVVTRVISRLVTPLSRLQDFFGMGPGGPNETLVGGHHTGWDIFDRTRTIATQRAPGSGPSTIAPQIIGHVDAAIPRVHEKIVLSHERIFRIRPLGSNWGTIDRRGQQYVLSQEKHIAQRFKNSREFMCSRLFRGGFDLKAEGESWIPVDFTTTPGDVGIFGINYQVPSGNLGEVELLDLDQNAAISFVEPDGDTVSKLWDNSKVKLKWSNVLAPIVGQMLALNAAFEQVHGRPLRHVWCNSDTLNWMLNNTELKEVAGTANVVFSDWRQSPDVHVEGVSDAGHEVVFRGLPWLRVHVYDGGLNVDGSFVKFLPNDKAAFLPDPSSDWLESHVGSEIVLENVLDQGSEQFGLHAWTERHTQPAGFDLITVDNWLPVPLVPQCMVYATVNWV